MDFNNFFKFFNLPVISSFINNNLTIAHSSDILMKTDYT